MTSSDSQRNGTTTRAFLILTGTVVLVWLMCVYPASLLNGNVGILWMTIAAFCCLIPGWIVVFLPSLDIFPTDQSVMAVQILIRNAFALSAVVVVRKFYPAVTFQLFFGWLAGFFVLCLAIEVWLLLSRRFADNGTAK